MPGNSKPNKNMCSVFNILAVCLFWFDRGSSLFHIGDLKVERARIKVLKGFVVICIVFRVYLLNSVSCRAPLNIAVIGTGIAGMSAAWLLQSAHRVTVYEKNQRLGGHSHTVNAPALFDSTPVDTGFIVYNEKNYPNLTALFRYLGVDTKKSEMSFSASLRGGSFEYSGSDLNGLLGQRSNLLKPRFWRMLMDILRFYREAPEVLKSQDAETLSLGEYLQHSGYGDEFLEDHLLPMGAAIWSTTRTEIAAYPALAFIRFFVSHGLLELHDRPQWRTVDGGSRAYVEKLCAGFADRISYQGVVGVMRDSAGVTVVDASGFSSRYDHVIFANHADEALAIIEDADEIERSLLGRWRYTANRAVLHSDHSLMPKRRRIWSSWNFVDDGCDAERACVTYWMNRLQSLDIGRPIFVTLNPVREPAKETIIGEFDYTHPYFDMSAMASQTQLWSLQGRRRSWFCGSYFGYGFHEDALQSGLAVAEELGGVMRPWCISQEAERIQRPRGRRAVA